MRKLIVFNHVSLDGYFVDADGSMSWAKMVDHDAEWNEFVAQNASGDSPLLFGRKTYEMMAQYWPTPMAKHNDAAIANRMNEAPKVVFSKTLGEATWNNTTLVKENMAAEVRRMKQGSGDGMTILGSGEVVTQLADEGLIDEYHVVVNPVVLGKGRTMFADMKEKLALKLTQSRAFGNGCVYLRYEPGA
jgi:dihydrofolate reductase